MTDSITRSRASTRPGKTLRMLGVFEEYFWLLQQRLPRTIVVAAEVHGRTTVEQWRAALGAVQAHHTILSARIHQKPGFRPCFELAPDAPLALKVVPSESGTRLFELISAELATRFAPDDALLRASILYSRNRTTLVLGADHAALDGPSLILLIRDLMRALTGEALGEPRAMPPSHDQWLGMRTSEHYALAMAPRVAPRVAPMGQASEASELNPADNAPLAVGDEQPLLQQIWFEPSVTSLVERHARDQQTTVHGALCAAVMLAGRALSKSWRDNTIRCASSIDARALLGASEHMGLFPALRGTELDPSTTPSFWDLARSVTQNLAARTTSVESAGGFSWPVLDMISAAADPDQLVISSRQRAPTLRIDNYGRLTIPSQYGRLRVKWVTPASMHGAPHTQNISVATVDGLLCMTNVSGEPVPSLLGNARRLLLAQLS
jgi:phthiocerol/phthiodiolone dimycocerosyl transferase-like enzyme